MSVFKVTEVNLGVVIPGKKMEVEFPVTKPIKVKSLTASCGCTTPHYDDKKQAVVAGFRVPKIPKHIKTTKYNSFKTITVITDEGESYKLRFTYTINQ